jgi:alkaline phosphatase D
MDQWPGYTAERMRLMEFLQQRQVSNPIVLTGDIHSNWVNELRRDDRREEEALVATEFVTTSISSGGNGRDQPPGFDALMSANPCVKFHNGQRGYVRCLVTPQSWKADYMVVDNVLTPGGHTTERASFVVESGNPAVRLA